MGRRRVDRVCLDNFFSWKVDLFSGKKDIVAIIDVVRVAMRDCLGPVDLLASVGVLVVQVWVVAVSREALSVQHQFVIVV